MVLNEYPAPNSSMPNLDFSGDREMRPLTAGATPLSRIDSGTSTSNSNSNTSLKPNHTVLRKRKAEAVATPTPTPTHSNSTTQPRPKKQKRVSKLRKMVSTPSFREDVKMVVPDGVTVPPVPHIPDGIEGKRVPVVGGVSCGGGDGSDGFGGLGHEIF